MENSISHTCHISDMSRDSRAHTAKNNPSAATNVAFVRTKIVKEKQKTLHRKIKLRPCKKY